MEMSRNPRLVACEDSQGRSVSYKLIIPPQIEDEPLLLQSLKGGAMSITLHTDKHLDLFWEPYDIDGHRDEALLEQFGLSSSWLAFWEGVEEISPPLILVYPYRCGICHREELYAEDPELDDFHPYHCHGYHKPPRSVLGTLARTYNLRRLEPRWVSKNTPMIFYNQRAVK